LQQEGIGSGSTASAAAYRESRLLRRAGAWIFVVLVTSAFARQLSLLKASRCEAFAKRVLNACRNLIASAIAISGDWRAIRCICLACG
jgi:hypothetical protein